MPEESKTQKESKKDPPTEKGKQGELGYLFHPQPVRYNLIFQNYPLYTQRNQQINFGRNPITNVFFLSLDGLDFMVPPGHMYPAVPHRSIMVLTRNPYGGPVTPLLLDHKFTMSFKIICDPQNRVFMDVVYNVGQTRFKFETYQLA